jgi:hypothetical protein
MKKYENIDNLKKRLHTLEITLQSGEYKDSVKQLISENCYGYAILSSFDPEDLYENNIGIVFSEDDDGDTWFNCTLKDDEGTECEIEGYDYELERLIVKLEIVGCEII